MCLPQLKMHREKQRELVLCWTQWWALRVLWTSSHHNKCESILRRENLRMLQYPTFTSHLVGIVQNNFLFSPLSILHPPLCLCSQTRNHGSQIWEDTAEIIPALETLRSYSWAVCWQGRGVGEKCGSAQHQSLQVKQKQTWSVPLHRKNCSNHPQPCCATGNRHSPLMAPGWEPSLIDARSQMRLLCTTEMEDGSWEK